MTYSIRDFRPGQRVWLDRRGSIALADRAIVQHVGRVWVYLTVYYNSGPLDERARPDQLRPREEPQP